MTCRPRYQVVITVNITAAMSRGSHPPWRILVRLAPWKVASVPPNATAARTSFQVGQWNSPRHAE